ncbi:MAG: type IV pilus modification PilV family protein [Planctomycetota bacterium]
MIAARRQSGFTLMEILLAIGILAVGITSVLFLFTMGVRSHQRARDRTRAALLGETVLNQIRADMAEGLPDRYDLDSGDPTKILPITGAAHAGFPAFTYDVAFEKLYPGDSRGDFYKVRVTVRWGNPEAEATERNSEIYETIVRRKNF